MRKRGGISPARQRTVVALTAALASLFAVHPLLAQTIDVAECTKLKTPGERLDCYERRVEAAEAQKAAAPTPTPSAASTPAPPAAPSPAATPPPAAATAAPSPVAPAAAAGAAAGVGAASPNPAQAAPAPPDKHDSAGKAQKADPAEIVATITELRTMEPNAWLITLDNHQVWRQSYPQPFLLQPGTHVTLRPSKWGAAYRLSAEGLNGYIQVQRIK